MKELFCPIGWQYHSICNNVENPDSIQLDLDSFWKPIFFPRSIFTFGKFWNLCRIWWIPKMLLDHLSNRNCKTHTRIQKKTISHTKLGHTVKMHFETTTCCLSTQTHRNRTTVPLYRMLYRWDLVAFGRWASFKFSWCSSFKLLTSKKSEKKKKSKFPVGIMDSLHCYRCYGQQIEQYRPFVLCICKHIFCNDCRRRK